MAIHWKVLVVSGSLLAAEALWHLVSLWRRRLRSLAASKEIVEVLFFPDLPADLFRAAAGTKEELVTANMAQMMRSSAISKDSSLYKLLQHLRSAEHSLDLCLFLFTCQEFAREILASRRRGVQVRLIVEYSNVGSSGCQVGRMRSEGIAVKARRQQFLMHHKFAIVDSNLLINGSFNWTSSAVMGNNENVVVTNHPHVVAKFCEEFERLWLADTSNAVISGAQDS